MGGSQNPELLKYLVFDKNTEKQKSVTLAQRKKKKKAGERKTTSEWEQRCQSNYISMFKALKKHI